MNGKNDYTKEIMGDLYETSDDNQEISMKDIVGNKDKDLEEQTPQYVIEDEEETDDSGEIEDTEEDTEDTEEIEDEPKYTKSQVEKLIQTRVGTMKKKLESSGKYKGLVENLASITGLSVEQFEAKVSQLSPADQAKILGVPEKDLPLVQSRINSTKTDHKTKDLNIRLEKAELKGNKAYSDLDLYEDEIDLAISDNPSLSVKQAYTLVKAELGLTAKTKDKEQAKRNGRVKATQRRVIKGTNNPGKTTTVKIPKDIVAKAKAIGMSPIEYYQFSSMKNIDDYRKMKTNQKGR